MLRLKETIRATLTTAFLALALTAVGCVEATGEVPTEEAFAEGELPPPISDDPEIITVDAEDFSGDHESSSSVLTDQIAPASAPCSCPEEDINCLSDWAKGQFGCDVCVTVLCNGEPGPHVCTDPCE